MLREKGVTGRFGTLAPHPEFYRLMSYIRGDYYSYVTGTDDEEAMVLTVHHRRSVHIPLPIFDEIVVMRYAELAKEGKLDETENRAV